MAPGEERIACTLLPTEYRQRIAEIASLSRDALRGVEQRGLVLDLHYAPEAVERVRTLVSQEQACCGFLHFELREGDDDVQLLVTMPPSAVDTVPELLTELTGGVLAEARRRT
ncbi:MAG TPA: hypothetical protein VMF13_17370 [Luteitalea sp.]|nr:hypothetical protein [Luteitalea sp.]